MEEKHSSKKVVPENYYRVLDCRTPVIFSDERYLSVFLSKSYDNGFYWLGELVQMSEQELFSKVTTSKENQLRIKRALKEIGLELGMCAPGWLSPDTRENYEPRL